MTVEESLTSGALKSWKMVVGRLNDFAASAEDEKLECPVAPGKNRVRYLLGHLAVAHDRMLPMLGLGERLHSELDAAYFENPEGTFPDPVSAADLRGILVEVHRKLASAFETLTPQEWLQKHAAVSAEDFSKDPSRNRLAVLLSRTNHASFHLGQMILTK